jgi:YesN/AraC family two-component response regulator
MKTILVIEDEVQTLDIFTRCLEFEGFRVYGAKDGASGIEIASNVRPDLIVCDIMMPDMDGYSVLSQLRSQPTTAPIPLIFLTAKVTMTDLRQGMELGADDYLTKPCGVDQFLAAINTRLTRQAQVCQAYQPQDSADQCSPGSEPSAQNTAQSSPYLTEKTSLSIFPDCPKLAPVFRFIEAHYCQPINLADVANTVGYSPAYLTTLVQNQTGRSVKRWIIERRMSAARQLLADKAQSVKQVAAASGYTDPGYFTRQFRQLHGVSPQAWRETAIPS